LNWFCFFNFVVSKFWQCFRIYTKKRKFWGKEKLVALTKKFRVRSDLQKRSDLKDRKTRLRTVGDGGKGFPGTDWRLAGRLTETVADSEPRRNFATWRRKKEGSVNLTKGFLRAKMDKLAIFREKENSIRQI
jgi:hypothetical protein